MSTPISAGLEKFIILYNIVSGPIYFIINSMIMITVIRMDNTRTRTHRNHFITLQSLLILTDSFFSLGCCVCMTGDLAFYSPNFLLPPFMNMKMCMCVGLLFLIGIANTYFSSVLARYQVVTPHDSPDRYSPCQELVLRYAPCLMFGFAPVLYWSLPESELTPEEVNEVVPWISEYPVHLVLRFTIYLKGMFAGLWCVHMFFLVFVIILFSRMVTSLRMRTKVTSASTRRAQNSAIIALALQIFVPLTCMVVPGFGLIVGMAFSFFSRDFNALTFLLFNTHALFNSAVTIAFSAHYRQSMAEFISRRVSLMIVTTRSVTQHENSQRSRAQARKRTAGVEAVSVQGTQRTFISSPKGAMVSLDTF
ncbi:hypothetical protein PRIPAC_95688 [Pristionchus pacificus]|uniref:G protein-coupled receptor n=1 Tax=Pristionchus pacificus TaxID=54126 RepID=A0A2A6BC27_PRIPA|nr:hypothetical protein PRIPAC_95688 [Pristionchus pacificus]|eukprot:PDM63414.1 G protein-coupled receptor [Pristionchus pacificus]